MFASKPLLTVCGLVLLVACAAAPSRTADAPDRRALHRSDDPAKVLQAARKLMASDENMALVTVDADGQPRVRTVRAFPAQIDPADPRSGLRVWVMTRESTRKLAQLQENPRATLYFNDDEKLSYLAIMGRATIHTDPGYPAIRELLGREEMQGYAEYFWPAFPEGFVMIAIEPDWIEFMAPPDVMPQEGNWRPQAVEFDAD